jgi:hypothetical protein
VPRNLIEHSLNVDPKATPKRQHLCRFADDRRDAIQACFKRQLNKNVEAYVDDVVVKTRNSDTLIADLEETFASLREYRWKLNPNKCVFGVP